MEHPGIDIIAVKRDMNLEEIQGKILELRHKMTFAYHMQNQNLMNQLEMALEVYTRAQNEILEEMFSSQDNDHGGQIDVS